MEPQIDPEAQRPTAATIPSPRARDEGNDLDVTNYGDTSATYWKLYVSEAEINDKKEVDSLRGDTSSMVFLNSLFSSIVASFIIQVYQTLLPDNNQPIVNLLSQLVSQSNPSQSPSPSPTTLGNSSFHPPSSAIRINIVLFISFFLSMMSAVACALIQQWCQDYMKYAYPRAAPHQCGRVRTYLYQGLHRFQMRRFMYGTHVLLHISVFLFFWAISDFFYTVHHLFGSVARYCLVASIAVYMALSIFPLIFSNSPYNTPLTPPLRASGMILLYSFRVVKWWLCADSGKGLTLTRRPYFKGLSFDRAHLFLIEAKNRAAKLEAYAMKWLFRKNDFSDKDMDKFLEGLPGYVSSSCTEKDQLDKYLTADYTLGRIREHFLTCATSLELSEEASISRVLCCVKSLRLIFRRSIEPDQNISESDKKKLQQQMKYIRDIIGDLQILCELGQDDPVVALRASCIRGLAVHGLLTQIAQPDRGATSNRFPVSLIPLYAFFFPHDHEGGTHWLDVRRLSEEDSKRKWKALLSDGPLLNLTMLAKVVLSSKRAPPLNLSFYWRTLDILLKSLEITRTKASDYALNRFDEEHNAARERVQGMEWGFRIAPLLEVLDAVARGRRLSEAFSDHSEYHGRADIIFGKEHLRNRDLLEAFARCLPGYIAKVPPEKGREFMEGIVCNDNLWTGLQVNLWNAWRSDKPTSDKLRVFEECCTVLDVAFSTLEGSPNVDWRAPEFGSLSQHFEWFNAHCFRGTFLGRATRFRVGLIKARFCKAILTQFRGDVDREGAIFVRSQWDVASLARVFCTLGIGDEEDAEFWASHVNGDQIGAEFATKAREMIDIASRDGPLLIFCKVGHLVMTAVPLKGSGLEAKDIKKVWRLQEKMIWDEHLPLISASDKVWEELYQLRDQVNNLCGRVSGEDRDNLRYLLGMIDRVRGIRASGSRELGSSERSPEAQGPGTWAATNLTPPSGEKRVSRSSYASKSTAASGRRSGGPTGEDSLVGELSSPDLEKNTPASSFSSSHMDYAGSFSLAAPYPTMQSMTGGGIANENFFSDPFPFSPVRQYTGGGGERRAMLSRSLSRRGGSGLSASRSGPVTGTGGMQSSPHRPTANVLSNVTTSSPPGSFDVSDSSHSSTAPISEEDKAVKVTT